MLPEHLYLFFLEVPAISFIHFFTQVYFSLLFKLLHIKGVVPLMYFL